MKPRPEAKHLTCAASVTAQDLQHTKLLVYSRSRTQFSLASLGAFRQEFKQSKQVYRVHLGRLAVQAFRSQRVAAESSACIQSQRARRWATLGNLRCRWAVCCNSVGTSDRAAKASRSHSYFQ